MESTFLELSLEQQFQMRLIEQSAQQMDRDQMIDMLMQTSRLLMLKDNAIRNIIKNGMLV
jgi:hypothetical protein